MPGRLRASVSCLVSDGDKKKGQRRAQGKHGVKLVTKYPWHTKLVIQVHGYRTLSRRPGPTQNPEGPYYSHPAKVVTAGRVCKPRALLGGYVPEPTPVAQDKAVGGGSLQVEPIPCRTVFVVYARYPLTAFF